MLKATIITSARDLEDIINYCLKELFTFMQAQIDIFNVLVFKETKRNHTQCKQIV